MSRSILLILAVLCGWALTAPAKAEFLVRNYLEIRNNIEPDQRRDWLSAVGTGMVVYSMNEEVAGTMPAFCVPPNTALETYNFEDILDGYLALRKDSKSIGEEPVSIAMYFALVESFPCK
jgi:hypothetical protein